MRDTNQLFPVKGVEELVAEFTIYGSAQGYLSCVVAILFFGTIYTLEAIGRSTLFRPWFRGILADYAYLVRLIITYGLIDYIFLANIIISLALFSGSASFTSPGR